MKNIDYSFFENREDDWLASELKSEAKKSVWEFDGKDYVRQQHEDNCEAKEIKRQHEAAHNYYRTASKPKTQSLNSKKRAGGKFATIVFSTLFLLFGLIFVVSIIGEFSSFDAFGVLAVGVPFISLLFFGVFISTIIKEIKKESRG